MSTFQIDLVTFNEKLNKSNNKSSNLYVLLCVDEVSKYAFCSFLKRKLSKDVIVGFSLIIDKIKKMQMNNIFQGNNHITFYADFGQEFIFEAVKNYCETLNSKIINVGMPGVTKVYIIERLIKTIQEMIAVNLHNISNKDEYKKEFKLVLKMYNNQNHSFINSSPIKYLSSINIRRKPWNISMKKEKVFNYFLNKNEIAQKLEKTKIKFPLKNSVRLFNKIGSLFDKKVKKNYKKSHYSTWSDEIYFVDGYKIPLLKESDIGIYLKDKTGKRIKGITYSEYLKKVKEPSYMQIKSIKKYMTKRKSIRCSFVNFPNSFYKDIKISDLNNYIISKKFLKKIKAWRENNDI